MIPQFSALFTKQLYTWSLHSGIQSLIKCSIVNPAHIQHHTTQHDEHLQLKSSPSETALHHDNIKIATCSQPSPIIIAQPHLPHPKQTKSNATPPSSTSSPAVHNGKCSDNQQIRLLHSRKPSSLNSPKSNTRPSLLRCEKPPFQRMHAVRQMGSTPCAMRSVTWEGGVFGWRRRVQNLNG